MKTTESKSVQLAGAIIVAAVKHGATEIEVWTSDKTADFFLRDGASGREELVRLRNEEARHKVEVNEVLEMLPALCANANIELAVPAEA